MKIRDSGMPDELQWSSFFDADRCLDALDFPAAVESSAVSEASAELRKPAVAIVDFGCGYGLFAVAAAARTKGTVFAIDLDPVMIAATVQNADARRIANLRTILRDFAEVGTGLPDESVDYAMLFNILHAERPLPLLQEAHRVLKPRGKVAVMHWVHDAATPRGPDLSIRPRPEQMSGWLTQAGFQVTRPLINLPPYHFGVVGTC